MKYLIDKPDYGRRVQVYRNLHKGCYSVRCKKLDRVIYHTDEINLNCVRFKVSQRGRMRVIREKRKNVHAVIEGTWAPKVHGDLDERVTYNPYTMEHFGFEAGNYILSTPEVRITREGVYV